MTRKRSNSSGRRSTGTRSYKSKSIVSGLSTKDILNMDINTFNKLNVSEMRKVVGRLVSSGNKRLREFERKAETDSPAYNSVMSSGGFFSTKGKDLNELRSEYVRAKSFFEKKSSTAKQWQDIKKDTVKQLQAKGVNINQRNFGDVLKIYERLKQMDSSVAVRGMKYNVMAEISTLSDDLNMEEKILAMMDRLDEIYEEQAGLENEFTGVSDFFEF